MQKLTMQDHVCLTENILKTLAKNRIITISDFLQEDTEKISIISKLSLSELSDVRSSILSRYSAPLQNGSMWLAKSLTKRKVIPTCIESLDTALNGGIPVGAITEICSLASSGKTQLCFQVAINCAKELESSVLYIDTKGDFSAVKIQKILDLHGCNHKQMAAIMLKIKVVHIWTLEDAVQLLSKVKSETIDNLGLIIIDSLPCLMFQHLGDDNKIGLKLLNELVNNLRFISNRFEAGVICTNIQTRWLDQDVPDMDDDVTSISTKDSIVERRIRCLGKYWQHIPSVLCVIEKSESNTLENNKCNEIQMQVFKSTLPKQSKCFTFILN
ncbi:DNA repair protein RAD51 homolog 4 [Epargyreus clarus]|uniref:DNA repair protein RAD51 homolog 4 n=1 Tax=Epargyreus clarus TaxID=520877 RepID=UPI003C2C1D7F